MVRAVCSSPMLFRTRLWETLFRFLVLVVLAPPGAIQHPQPQQVELRAAVHTAFDETVLDPKSWTQLDANTVNLGLTGQLAESAIAVQTQQE